MGKLTTHVLDTMHGAPAAGLKIALYRIEAGTPRLVTAIALNADGRADAPLLEGESLSAGHYRLVFEVAEYFRVRGVNLPEPPFLGAVPNDYGIADQNAHYHVPLLASPRAYSTYRGS